MTAPKQLDLLDAIAHARHTDPVTSHEAAASVQKIRQSQEHLLKLFRRFGSMTDTVLADEVRLSGFPMSSSGIRTRRSELVALGKLKDSGRKEILPSGRRSIVWELA